MQKQTVDEVPSQCLLLERMSGMRVGISVGYPKSVILELEKFDRDDEIARAEKDDAIIHNHQERHGRHDIHRYCHFHSKVIISGRSQFL
ncbi:hypothetical protein ACH3XW_50540 [Acanthocheilonema viteae]